MGEIHEQEQSRYTIGFLVLLFILLASVGAAALKAMLVWLGN